MLPFKKWIHWIQVSITHRISHLKAIQIILFRGLIFYLLHYFVSRTICFPSRKWKWNVRSFFGVRGYSDVLRITIVTSVSGCDWLPRNRSYSECFGQFCCAHGSSPHRRPQYAWHAPKFVIKIRYVCNCIFVPQVFEKFKQHTCRFY